MDLSGSMAEEDLNDTLENQGIIHLPLYAVFFH